MAFVVTFPIRLDRTQPSRASSSLLDGESIFWSSPKKHNCLFTIQLQEQCQVDRSRLALVDCYDLFVWFRTASVILEANLVPQEFPLW